MNEITKAPAQYRWINRVVFVLMLSCTAPVQAQSPSNADVCNNSDLKANVTLSINQANARDGKRVKSLANPEFVSRNGRQSLTCRYTVMLNVKTASGPSEVSAKVLALVTSASDGSIDLNTKFEK
jgi:hypothetical protein